MTETILLVIFAVAILAGFIITKAVRKSSLDKRTEAVIRIAACFIFAAIAHAIYVGASKGQFAFLIAVIVNSLVIYAVTHVADRVVANA